MAKQKKEQKKPTAAPVKKKKHIHQSPKGMHDTLPADWPYFERVYKAGDAIGDYYGFNKIETTLLEDPAIFKATLGETSDVVEKEMFTVRGGKGGDTYVLRPEGTASIVRSYLQHGLSHLPQPAKLRYAGPMFRHEQPQAGRFRAFHQIGFEVLGGGIDAIYDAQVITALVRTLEQLKIKGTLLQLNSIGCRICRPHYRKKLTDYYRKHEKELCADCRRRLKENPLRLLDCKKESCVPFKEKAPSLLDSICVSCSGHLKLLLEYIDEVRIPYTLNPHLVRGFDYYSKTVFECFTEGSTMALFSGGRYDYLVETLGGRPTPGVGGALGIERVVELIKANNLYTPKATGARVFISYIGDLAKKRVLSLVEEFRRAGIRVQESFGKDVLKRQMQAADRQEADLALIVGQKEVFEETLIIRDLSTGAQETVPVKKAVDEVKKRLK